MKNVELELRAEVSENSFKKVLNKLQKEGKLSSKTNRLSVMFFGKIGKHVFDIRVRITNGKGEVVVKKGAFHAHDRTETAQSIDKKQFMGMARVFSQFEFKTKVGEREAYNFDFPKDVIVSLVRAKNIGYLEIEKMSSKTNLKKDHEFLQQIAKDLNVRIIESSKDFDRLCDKLSESVDWDFAGLKKDYKKLENLLTKY